MADPVSTPTGSFWAIARRPKWIGALVLALAVAAGFAALGQWQLSRSIEGGETTPQQTETVEPLAQVAMPGTPVTSVQVGQKVAADVRFVPGDWVVLEGRSNLVEQGYWVVGHAIVDDGPSLAVAIGWAPTADDAEAAVRALDAAPPDGRLEGRYLASESPEQSDFENGRRTALAVSELINLWVDAPAGVYGGYVIAAQPAGGLEVIAAPPPDTGLSLNLLNVFYALEWALFAGFAVYLWYRLVRDEWEGRGRAQP